jgi:hypothetical protein
MEGQLLLLPRGRGRKHPGYQRRNSERVVNAAAVPEFSGSLRAKKV